MTENDRNDLKKALHKALTLVESTVSWVEARGWTNEQEFINWEDELNRLSCKDHRVSFAKYKCID